MTQAREVPNHDPEGRDRSHDSDRGRFIDPSLQECFLRLYELESKYTNLVEGIRQALTIADLDAEMSLTRVRKVLEYIIRDVYEYRVNEPAGTRPLENLIQRLSKDGHMPRRLSAYANTVRELGNLGTHTFGERIKLADIQQSLSQVMLVLEWYVEQDQSQDSNSANVMHALADVSTALSAHLWGLQRDEEMGAVASVAATRSGRCNDLTDRSINVRRPSGPVTVVPKGLHSFDARDSDFFLSLLPGSRNKDSLPDSIRLWKERIECLDEMNFTVGLIYGPSGCGKTSLVMAGLLPRLAEHVISTYVEATQEDTEVRLLKGLRKSFPRLPTNGGLVDIMVALRAEDVLARGTKALIIIDQFEQWLHSRGASENTELVAALRQVDGSRVQVIVMVRDDFWMAATRFMRRLDIPLLEGQNSAAVDLFDCSHARRVLVAFGEAFGNLQESALTEEQNRFLDQAVAGLSDEGKVVPVRLSLFAEMVKGKPWTSATLKAVGGTAGIGANFLDETFSAPTSPPGHRFHQKAAKAVLKALLPQEGSDIRGQMKSHHEMLVASGYSAQPNSFAELMQILDGELRLVTPTDLEGVSADETDAVPRIQRVETDSTRMPDRFYQLTHDYLVPWLRQWLTCKQRESRRGRAEICLEERAAFWKDRQRNRYLPGWWEWVRIGLFSRPQTWTSLQRRMMNKASRYYSIRMLLLLAAIGSLVWAGHEYSGSTRASFLVGKLAMSATTDTPRVIADLSKFRRWADPLLENIIDQPDTDANVRLHARLALLPVDSAQVNELADQMLEIDKPSDLEIIRSALQTQAVNSHQELARRFWKVLEDRQAAPGRRLRAACGVAAFDPVNEKRWAGVRYEVADLLTTQSPLLIGDWTRTLTEAGPFLVGPLETIFRDSKRPESQRSLAASLLTVYAANQPEELADLAMDAEPAQFAVLRPLLLEQQGKSIARMQEALRRLPVASWKDLPAEASWTTPDHNLVARIENSHGMLTEHFAFCQELPFDVFEVVCDGLRKSGYRPLCVRPYRAGSGVQVAAVWTRDRADWRMILRAKSKDVARYDAEQRKQGFWPLDVAGYEAEDEEQKRTDLYAVLWTTQPSEPVIDARLDVGLQNWPPARPDGKSREDEGFLPRVQNRFEFRNQSRYSGVWWKSDQPVEEKGFYSFDRDEAWYESNLFRGNLEVDVCLSPSDFPDSRQHFKELLSQAESELKSRPESFDACFRRSIAHWGLSQDRLALDDLNATLKRNPTFVPAYQYRALVHARLGNIPAAKRDLAEFQRRSSDYNVKTYLDAVVSVHSGDDAAWMGKVETALAQHHGDPRLPYYAARSYAVAARAAQLDRADLAKTFADRAVALLQQSGQLSPIGAEQLQSGSDLDVLYSNADFQKLLNQTHPERRYAAVWRRSAQFISEELHGLDRERQRDRCRELTARGYRPSTISVCSLGEGKSLTSAIVWQVPTVSENERNVLAKRQAQAAAILLQMGEPESVWQLLQHQPDPGVRTYLIHRLSPLGADPTKLLDHLRKESDVSARQALILCLGEFSPNQIADANDQKLVEYLLSLYRDDPDSGIHSAVDWLLRLPPWNQTAKLRQIDDELTKRPLSGKRWFVNSQRQTFAILPSVSELWVGSPLTEAGRAPHEELRRICIPRSFGMSTKDVTVEQFEHFARPHAESVVRNYSPNPDCPMIAVTWFEAAQYCRWLSEQEHVPENQMCFPPFEEIKDGMQLPADYLLRRGYRLPTEFEWEYACRAGAITSRFYGSSDELLGKYAWYNGTAVNHTWPVGALKPNDFGLFDICGNVWQWCQDSPPLDQQQMLPGELTIDDSTSRNIGIGEKRPLRGGAFYNHSSFVRSAYRDWMQLTNRPVTVGLRVVRTLP